MKRLFNIPLMPIMIIAVLAGVLAISAKAQTSSTQRVIANIPFAFSAGKTTLPAGRYTITVLNPTSDRKTLQVRSVNGRASALVLTMTSDGNVSDTAKLVFERSPQGFTTLIVVMTFLSGLNLLFLGLLGEYLGRVYEEVKRRPLYVVEQVARGTASEAPRPRAPVELGARG